MSEVRPQSRRDEDPVLDLEEIKNVRRQSILPIKTEEPNRQETL